MIDLPTIEADMGCDWPPVVHLYASELLPGGEWVLFSLSRGARAY